MPKTIAVTVAANTKINWVTQACNDMYYMHTTSPAINGKANQSVIKLLTKHFKVPKSKVHITNGHKSKYKTIVRKF